MNTINGSDCDYRNEATSVDTSNIDLSSLDLTNYAKKSYVNAQDNLKVNNSGDRMSGDLDMNNNNILKVANPIRSTDAASKQYVERAANNVAIS